MHNNKKKKKKHDENQNKEPRPRIKNPETFITLKNLKKEWNLKSISDVIDKLVSNIRKSIEQEKEKEKPDEELEEMEVEEKNGKDEDYIDEDVENDEERRTQILKHIIVRRIQEEAHISDEKLPIVLALATLLNKPFYDVERIAQQTPMQTTNVQRAKHLHEADITIKEGIGANIASEF